MQCKGDNNERANFFIDVVGQVSPAAPGFADGTVHAWAEQQVAAEAPELARDLDGTPALCQGSLIYARKEALAFYLWDRLADPIQQNKKFLKISILVFL